MEIKRKRVFDNHSHIGPVPGAAYYGLPQPVKPTYDYNTTEEYLKGMAENGVDRALVMSNYGYPDSAQPFTLNPLVAVKNADSTAALSRDHTILIADSGLITITGGKWTTYRRMAEDVIDHAEMIGGFGVKRCVTHDLMIHGSATVLDNNDPLAVYGSDAAEVRDLMRKEPEWSGKVHPRLDLTCAEVIFHTRHEMARSVEDVLARRSRSLLLDAQSSMSAAPRVAALMAFELGWSAAKTDHEVEHFQKLACGYILAG